MPHTNSAKRALVAEINTKVDHCTDCIAKLEDRFQHLEQYLLSFEDKVEFIATKCILRECPGERCSNSPCNSVDDSLHDQIDIFLHSISAARVASESPSCRALDVLQSDVTTFNISTPRSQSCCNDDDPAMNTSFAPIPDFPDLAVDAPHDSNGAEYDVENLMDTFWTDMDYHFDSMPVRSWCASEDTHRPDCHELDKQFVTSATEDLSMSQFQHFLSDADFHFKDDSEAPLLLQDLFSRRLTFQRVEFFLWENLGFRTIVHENINLCKFYPFCRRGASCRYDHCKRTELAQFLVDVGVSFNWSPFPCD